MQERFNMTNIDVVSKILDNLHDDSDENCANIIYGAYMARMITKEQMLNMCHKYGIVSVEDFWDNTLDTVNVCEDLDRVYDEGQEEYYSWYVDPNEYMD